MKKFIIILFFVFTFSILNIVGFLDSPYNYLTIADSGFDSDYGGYDDSSWDSDYSGGSFWDDDYSSSWDDDYHSNSRNNYGSGVYISGSTEPWIIILALIICSAPPIIIFVVPNIIRKRKYSPRRKKLTIKDILYKQFQLVPGDGQNIKLVQTAYNNYVKIQEAWMNRDLSPVKHLLTDEMYNMYQMQIETLIEDNQINVMSDFKFISGGIVNITRHNNLETINITLCVKCKDYIKMANSNKIINGNKHAKITYIYELTFVRDINQEKTINCPACGAFVEKNMSTTCPYCNNTLLLTSSEITLSNKVIKYQFKD